MTRTEKAIKYNIGSGLEIVYYTKDGSKFVDLDQAIKYQKKLVKK